LADYLARPKNDLGLGKWLKEIDKAVIASSSQNEQAAFADQAGI